MFEQTFSENKKNFFDLYIRIQDPKMLSQRFAEKTIEKLDLEDLHNYLAISYRVELERYLNRVLSEMKKCEFLNHYLFEKFLVKASEYMCTKFALDYMPDLSQQLLAKMLFGEKKIRHRLLHKFDELAERIKAETHVS